MNTKIIGKAVGVGTVVAILASEMKDIPFLPVDHEHTPHENYPFAPYDTELPLASGSASGSVVLTPNTGSINIVGSVSTILPDPLLRRS